MRSSPLDDMTDEQLNERLQVLAEALGCNISGASEQDEDAGPCGSMH